MLGGINRAINNLSSNGDCSGEQSTEEEFILSIYAGLLEVGIDINSVKQMDIIKYLEVMGNKLEEKQKEETKKQISNLLF